MICPVCENDHYNIPERVFLPFRPAFAYGVVGGGRLGGKPRGWRRRALLSVLEGQP